MYGVFFVVLFFCLLELIESLSLSRVHKNDDVLASFPFEFENLEYKGESNGEREEEKKE